MANVLVSASGRNSRPSWSSRVNTGRNESVMISSDMNSAGPTSLEAVTTRSRCRRTARRPAVALARPLHVLVEVLDHHDRRVDHGADGDGDPAQGHDVGVDPHPSDDRQRREDAERERGDRDERARACSRKSTQTRATMSDSSISVRLSVAIERWMRSVRS